MFHDRENFGGREREEGGGNGELITISLMCRRFVFPGKGEGGGLCLHDATVVHRRGSPPEFST